MTLDYLAHLGSTDARDLKGLTYADLTRLLSGTQVVGMVALREAVAKKLNLPVEAQQIQVRNPALTFTTEFSFAG